jgi:hypothetical protein
MARRDTARVVQSLAASRADGFLDHERWPEIAKILLTLGCDWPAVTDLAAMPLPSPSAVDDAVEQLAEQVGREVADLPTLDFWDTVCGLFARAWRLDVFDEVTAVYSMDTLWWGIRDLDRSNSPGLQIIWHGMALKEMHDHVDITKDATELLSAADRLIPADSVNGPFCEVVLEAVRDSFY